MMSAVSGVNTASKETNLFTSVLKSFNTTAAEHSTRVALCHDGVAVTYQELDTKATSLAGALRSAGVASSSLVGICMEQSIDFVVGVLGIIKCGAAYVPLDPSSPPARLEFMVDDAALSCIVTSFRYKRQLSTKVPTLLIDDLGHVPPAADLATIELKPEDLAYVMYTSGTTGQPKGVEITHGGLANLAQWCERAFQIVPADRTTLFAPVGFDAAVRELWPHLICGCTLVIPPEGLLRNPEELQTWLVLNRITISYLPTLLASRLVRVPWPADTSLRYIYTGGDALRDYPIPELPFRFVNEYGPAECTVFATSTIVPSLPDPTQPPSIGRAIEGVQIFILDENLVEVSQGETGEIYIGGQGLARGYRNNQELTDRSFLYGASGESQAKRIYKTGDLGRRTATGEIAFMGRNDDQVKIRGYRIECGEVETAIGLVAGVNGCSVVKRQYGDSDYRLVAYIVARPGLELTRDGLRQFLKSRVPEYMIPDEFVRIAEMPLTDNGKIDKRALPDPRESVKIVNKEVWDSPLERHLILILQRLLNVDQVGRLDNLFMLGGDSFAAMRLIAEVERDFDVRLTPQTVFSKPSLAELAMEIEQIIVARNGDTKLTTRGVETSALVRYP
jgi:amino acid adenylation domain-containing protein